MQLAFPPLETSVHPCGGEDVPCPGAVPQAILGLPISQSSDQWQLGCLLWWLATGYELFNTQGKGTWGADTMLLAEASQLLGRVPMQVCGCSVIAQLRVPYCVCMGAACAPVIGRLRGVSGHPRAQVCTEVPCTRCRS